MSLAHSFWLPLYVKRVEAAELVLREAPLWRLRARAKARRQIGRYRALIADYVLDELCSAGPPKLAEQERGAA